MGNQKKMDWSEDQREASVCILVNLFQGSYSSLASGG